MFTLFSPICVHFSDNRVSVFSQVTDTAFNSNTHLGSVLHSATHVIIGYHFTHSVLFKNFKFYTETGPREGDQVLT